MYRKGIEVLTKDIEGFKSSGMKDEMILAKK